MTHKTSQGHLTNTKQSRVNSDTAQVLASSPKDVLYSTDCLQLSSKRRQWLFISDERRQREFQARAAAAGNARSPGVRRRVAATISVDVTADHRRLQELRLVVGCKVSARYHGAVPWRHRKTRTQSRYFILSGTLNQWSSQSKSI